MYNLRIAEEHLQTDQNDLNNFLKDVTVINTSSALMIGKLNMWSVLVFYENKKSSKTKSLEPIDTSIEYDLSAAEEEKLDLLKKWRQEKSKEISLPAYMICHNKDLIAIIKKNPILLQDLQDIRGFGEKKIESYGEEIIKILKS